MLDAARRLIKPSTRSGVPPFMVMDVMEAAAAREAKGDKNLWSEKSYKDFVLRLDWRLKTDKGYMNKVPHILPDGQPHNWTLEYDPTAAEGRGRVAVTLDGRPTAVELGSGHQATGARFDRFGLVTTWIDGNGQQVYFDDLTYTCAQ